jgi:hypothetical protein
MSLMLKIVHSRRHCSCITNTFGLQIYDLISNFLPFSFPVSEWTTAVEEAAKKCCDAGPCSVEDFEDLCCRTMECLERCYGPTFLQRIRNRFRYFDILIRPHPNSKGRNGRDLLLDDDLEAEAEAVEAEAVAEEAEALLAEQLKEAAEAAAEEEEEDAAAHMAKRVKP